MRMKLWAVAGALAFFGVLLDNQAGGLDGILYDHLAFQPVPIPAAIWLFGAALSGLLACVRYWQSPNSLRKARAYSVVNK